MFDSMIFLFPFDEICDRFFGGEFQGLGGLWLSTLGIGFVFPKKRVASPRLLLG